MPNRPVTSQPLYLDTPVHGLVIITSRHIRMSDPAQPLHDLRMSMQRIQIGPNHPIVVELHATKPPIHQRVQRIHLITSTRVLAMGT